MVDNEYFDYWLYLESYTFLFYNENEFVIYNTLNSAYIDCFKYSSAGTVLLELYSTKGSYCTGVTSDQLEDALFVELVSKIRDTFSGGIIRNKGKIPFIFKPTLRIYLNPAKAEIKEDKLLGINTLLYLHEVSFYLDNPKMELDEVHEDCIKQFLCPSKTEKQVLTFDYYRVIFRQLSVCRLDKINIIPKMASDNNILPLLQLSQNYKLKTNVILPYKKYTVAELESFFHYQRLTLRVIIYFPVNVEELKQTMNLFSGYNIVWIFVVSNEDDITSLEIINDNPDIKTELLPWYNGHNQDFFEKYVFNTFEDIIEVPISRQKIFRRQILNENFFGKLVIFPDGEVYSNMNSPSIGNLCKEKLTKIIYNEINNTDSFWFKIRDEKPCIECINKYLCPSISNYEIVMDKYDMCSLSHKIKMQIKRLYPVLLLCVLFLCSCGGEDKRFTLDNCPIVAKHDIVGTDTIVVFDLSLLGKDTLEIPLSPFFSDFEVVRLENTDEALTDASVGVWVSDNYVGVYSYILSNYKFYNRNGNYLNTTAKLGDGPDNFIFFLDDCYIDEKNQRIYLLGQMTSKLLVFDFEGKPQKHIPLAYKLLSRGRFRIDTEKGRLIVMTLPRVVPPSIIWEQDLDGNVIGEIASSRFIDPNPANFSGVEGAFNTSNIDFTVSHWSQTALDTFYHYQAGSNRLQPIFTTRFAPELIKHYYIELPGHYLVRLINVSFIGVDKPRVPTILIDKKTLRGTYVRFKYDMLGNIDGQKWLSFNQGYCISNLYSYELKEQLSRALAQPELLTAEMKKKLTELNNSIADDDNNILLMGKLK
ncbi:MAG: TIGR04150 pseudo-rSAM protein [Bacteroidales bacterium]|jgi:pseudo-rSAM protein|nr:TIGR04150 pseudo-rSAM protein [Bacteroidales bacterium]